MLFKELLSSINKWEIVAEMRNEGFAQIYDRLMEMEPAEKSRTILMVVDQWDDVADEAYVDVMGYSVEDDEYYAESEWYKASPYTRTITNDNMVGLYGNRH